MTRGARQGGFTLLEVLVALVVLGVLALALRQGVAFGLTARTTQARMVAGRGDLDAAARALRRLVEHMDPGAAAEGSGFSAGPHSLAFATDLPVAASALPRRTVNAALGVDGNGRLMLRWTLRRHVMTAEPSAAQETELLRGVSRLDLDYWQTTPSGGGNYVSNWSGRSLPALVRMRIVFPPGDSRRWPDLVAAPVREQLEE